MVDNSWVCDLQTTVFSRLKAIGTSNLKSKYPNIRFTTSAVDPSKASFPTVYVHEIDITPISDGMEHTFNAKDVYSIQVEVFANDSNKTDSRYIGKVLMNIMNTMSFRGVPITDTSNNDYTRTVARYQREIHANDVF